RAGGNGGRGDAHLLRLPRGALAADSHQQPARAHPARDPAAHPCRGRGSRRSISAQPRPREAATHTPPAVVYEEISQHRAAQGPADERCDHRVSQGRVPLSQTESAKDSGHYRAWSAAHEFILASNTEISRKRLDDYQHRPAEYVNAGLLLRGMERNFDY